MTDNEQPYDGLGIAIGIVGAGVVCLWAPRYLDATDGWNVTWVVVGALFGLVGVAGAFTELDKLRGNEKSGFGGDIGVAIFLAGAAGILFVLENRGSISGNWGTFAKVSVVTLLFWAAVGLGRGFVRYLTRPRSSRQRQPGARGAAVLSVITGVVGLATAIVGFVRATRGV